MQPEGNVGEEGGAPERPPGGRGSLSQRAGGSADGNTRSRSAKTQLI